MKRTRRSKKPLQKTIQIDDKTWIEVNADIPDEIARSNYQKKVTENQFYHHTNASRNSHK